MPVQGRAINSIFAAFAIASCVPWMASCSNSKHLNENSSLSSLALHITSAVVRHGDQVALDFSIENRGCKPVLVDDQPDLFWTKIYVTKPGDIRESDCIHPIEQTLKGNQRHFIILPPLSPSQYKHEGRTADQTLHFEVILEKDAPETDRSDAQLQVTVYINAASNLVPHAYQANVTQRLPLQPSTTSSGEFTSVGQD